VICLLEYEAALAHGVFRVGKVKLAKDVTDRALNDYVAFGLKGLMLL